MKYKCEQEVQGITRVVYLVSFPVNIMVAYVKGTSVLFACIKHLVSLACGHLLQECTLRNKEITSSTDVWKSKNGAHSVSSGWPSWPFRHIYLRFKLDMRTVFFSLQKRNFQSIVIVNVKFS